MASGLSGAKQNRLDRGVEDVGRRKVGQTFFIRQNLPPKQRLIAVQRLQALKMPPVIDAGRQKLPVNVIAIQPVGEGLRGDIGAGKYGVGTAFGNVIIG